MNALHTLHINKLIVGKREFCITSTFVMPSRNTFGLEKRECERFRDECDPSPEVLLIPVSFRGSPHTEYVYIYKNSRGSATDGSHARYRIIETAATPFIKQGGVPLRTGTLCPVSRFVVCIRGPSRAVLESMGIRKRSPPLLFSPLSSEKT